MSLNHPFKIEAAVAAAAVAAAAELRPSWGIRGLRLAQCTENPESPIHIGQTISVLYMFMLSNIY
jgi:hypothetical protein